MAINSIKVDIQGLAETNRALKAMTDEKGTLWKKKSFQVAGKKAMRPVLSAAKRNAPFGKRTDEWNTAGLTRNTLTLRSHYKNKPPSSGKYKPEYTIYTTLSPKFESLAYTAKTRKSAYRYPFAQEVGIPTGTYERQSRSGKKFPYKRKAPRKALAFQSRALGSNAQKVVNIFVGSLRQNISLFAKKQYDKLPQALKSQHRRRR